MRTFSTWLKYVARAGKKDETKELEDLKKAAFYLDRKIKNLREMIIWLTGQPGSGKTTICKEILELKDNRIFHIDGDDLRDLFENKDYSEQGRRKKY